MNLKKKLAMLLLIANLLISYLESTHAFLDGKASWLPQLVELKKQIADGAKKKTDESVEIDESVKGKKAKSEK